MEERRWKEVGGSCSLWGWWIGRATAEIWRRRVWCTRVSVYMFMCIMFKTHRGGTDWPCLIWQTDETSGSLQWILKYTWSRDEVIMTNLQQWKNTFGHSMQVWYNIFKITLKTQSSLSSGTIAHNPLAPWVRVMCQPDDTCWPSRAGYIFQVIHLLVCLIQLRRFETSM